MKKTILGVNIDSLSKEEALRETQKLIEQGRKGNSYYIVKPNAEILTYAFSNPKFKNILNQAAFALPDGVGLLFASKFLNKSLKNRVGSSDLMEKILKLCQRNNYSIGLFGGNSNSNKSLAIRLKERYEGLKILLQQDGFNFNEAELVNKLKILNPDVLFVALGFPKQEEWIFNNYKQIGLPLMIAEGGSFDFLSGEVRRAPLVLRKVGLEWFFRLLQEPWRIKRQFSLVKFLYLVLKEKFSQ